MTEVQITTLLAGIVCFLIILRVLRHRAAQREEMEDFEVVEKPSVSYDTGRDERSWRRAYSRM